VPTLKELQLGPYAKSKEETDLIKNKKVSETKEEDEEEEVAVEEPAKPYCNYKPIPNPHEVYRQEQMRLQQLREEAKRQYTKMPTQTK